MNKVIELAKKAGLPTRMWRREIKAFYNLARADYEEKLSAVMPADFKDWRENNRSEWPEIAAWVIANLREQRADLEAEADSLSKTLEREALARENCMRIRADLAAERDALQNEIDHLRSALAQQGEQPVAWQPIETAPKYESILIYQPKFRRTTIAINDGFEWKHATHWMPLPPAPKETV